MPSVILSRRAWLVTAALAPTSIVRAEPPSTPQRRETGRLPIRSRVMRLKSPDGEPAVVTAIAVDPRGELLAVAGDDNDIRILYSSSLAEVKTLHGHRDLIRTLAFDREGKKLVSAGNDGRLILWNREKSFAADQHVRGTPALARVCFSPDSTEIAAVGFDDSVFILGRGERGQAVYDCNCKDLRAAAYRDDQQIIAVAGRSGALKLFDAVSGKLVGDHPLHEGRVHDLAFHHHAYSVVSVGEDGYVNVFDTQNRVSLQHIRVTTGKLFAVAVINSQTVAVAGSDNVLRIVHTDEGNVIRALDGHQGSISTLAAGGGWLFSGGYDATLRRWSIAEIVPGEQRIAERDPRVDR